MSSIRKPESRPRQTARLQDSGEANPRTEAITAINATQSPFFSRLPANVRNAIYDLVLGGNHLHTKIVAGRLDCYACRAKLTDCEYAEAASEDFRSVEPSNWAARHDRCHYEEDEKITVLGGGRDPIEVASMKKEFGLITSADSPRAWQALIGMERPLDLRLLLVSRRIHSEAALLPFCRNTFQFKNYDALLDFTSNVLPQQRAALATVVIDDAFQEFDQTSSIEKALHAGLPGLRRVTINMSVWKDFEDTPFHEYEPTEVRRRLAAVERAFCGRSLVRMTICMLAVCWSPDFIVGIWGSPQALRSLARETERSIMRSQSRHERFEDLAPERKLVEETGQGGTEKPTE